MRPLLLAASLLLALTLSAQERRGSVYLSGGSSAAYGTATDKQIRSAYLPYNLLSRLEGIRVNSFRTGYFLTNRLLLGTRADFNYVSGDASLYPSDYTELSFRPFVRYYVRDGGADGTSVFGEAGFGTLGLGEADFFTKDYHLGVGAERFLASGILAMASLNYNVNAELRDYASLRFGLNVLTGQLARATADAPLAAGTLTAAGQLLEVGYGITRDGGNRINTLMIDLSPRLGYFPLDGLLLETGLVYSLLQVNRDYSQQQLNMDYRRTDLELRLQARYYLLQQGRLLPYVGAGISYVRIDQGLNRLDDPLVQHIEALPWQLSAGVSYFLSPRLAIDLEAEYERGLAESGPTPAFSYSEAQRRIGVAAGLRFFLAR
ncbi:outer membrane protein [Lewinella sp. IMCC34183]|uniref:outer membrane protein n=1 Tax=Lewinella sp. IMCC34183 TaxID=2248762 RepID=UPI000E2271EE|nr:outer membrane beta-barrel protein [Lewinella sp. IMCC34183]